jgi:pimeloyl-ACP methyl ester carboxylesterase
MILPPMTSALTFAAVMLITLALLCGLLIVLMAHTLLRPNRMTDAKATWVLQRLSPGDLGLAFEDVRFSVRDEQTGRPLQLAAWWIVNESAGAPASRTVLLIHGYADAKVGSIAWAPTRHGLGWNILAIDLRAHGESGGTLSTAGYWERHDVNELINQFRAQRPRETSTLVLFGVSLGAAVAVTTAALRDDLAGIILESPFADYRLAVAAHGRMRGLPGGILRDIAIALAERMSGADFRAVRPRDLIPKLNCPVMIIHAGDDPFIPPEDAAAMAASLKTRSHEKDLLWSIPEAGHVLGLAAVGPDEYRRRVADFLNAIHEPAATGAATTTAPPRASPA